jgi:hypothetical protein
MDRCFKKPSGPLTAAAGNEPQTWLRLPFLHLRKLDLKGLSVHLESSDGSPGVLQHCTNLTALSLKDCRVQDAASAFAAIAALPQLRSLSLAGTRDTAGRAVFGDLHNISQLTLLALNDGQAWASEHTKQLSQLSALTNLANLKLSCPPEHAVPGGVPSQLVQLTALDFRYQTGYGAEEQFCNLSSLTALQMLAVSRMDPLITFLSDKLTGIDYLSQLTALHLTSTRLELNTQSTSKWAQFTALNTMCLYCCLVQPQAIAAFTQLRALSMMGVAVTGSLEELLVAVSQLPQLTFLCFMGPRDTLKLPRQRADALRLAPPPMAAFTALTASTNLRFLELSCWMECKEFRKGCVLFSPGITYPNLHVVDLLPEPVSRHADRKGGFEALPISRHQLEQLCSSCPGVQRLAFTLCKTSSDTAFQPLLQLSALTNLRVQDAGGAATAAALVGVAAQLTGLKRLALKCLSQLTDPALLQLTALTRLEELTLATCWQQGQPDAHITFQNKVRLLSVAAWISVWAPPSVPQSYRRNLADHLALQLPLAGVF